MTKDWSKGSLKPAQRAEIQARIEKFCRPSKTKQEISQILKEEFNLRHSAISGSAYLVGLLFDGKLRRTRYGKYIKTTKKEKKLYLPY